jgi:chromosomal replication initiator protein
MSKSFETTWENCLSVIKDNVSIQAFKTWFEPIKPIKLKSKILTIQVPSQFFYEWLEEHYIDLLKKTIRKEIGPDAKLEYSIIMENNMGNKNPYTIKIPTTEKKALRNPQVTMPLDIGNNAIRNPFVIPGLRKVNVDSNLNPNYSFENFIEGDCNRLARSAGFAVAEKPGGTAFNPLLIYGGVGLGKTHLGHAIGIAIKNRFPNKTVLYVSSEKFTHQFIDSVKNNSTNDFIHFYQMIDVLIIDDVQFFSGKEKTQDVFFSHI